LKGDHVNILILYGEMSSRDSAVCAAEYSPLLDASSWHGMGFKVNVAAIPAWNAGQLLGKQEYDIILVYNALEDYLANRFRVQGRPWVASLSFHFEDTHAFYTNSVPVHDMGIDAVFTNCKPFVERGAPFMPVKFMWPPTGYFSPIKPLPDAEARVGAYVSSVEDRDFSLLEKCFEIMAEAGHHDMKLFLHADVDSTSLPKSRFAEECTIVTVNSMVNARMRAYIPTPRVSDILMGVVDEEMILALALGFWPVWVKHRKFEHLQSQMQPIVDSMARLRTLLLAACDSKPNPLFTHEPTLIEIGKPDMELIHAIKMAYRRKKGAAAGGS
jgi:hypothetical protein